MLGSCFYCASSFLFITGWLRDRWIIFYVSPLLAHYHWKIAASENTDICVHIFEKNNTPVCNMLFKPFTTSINLVAIIVGPLLLWSRRRQSCNSEIARFAMGFYLTFIVWFLDNRIWNIVNDLKAGVGFVRNHIGHSMIWSKIEDGWIKQSNRHLALTFRLG